MKIADAQTSSPRCSDQSIQISFFPVGTASPTSESRNKKVRSGVARRENKMEEQHMAGGSKKTAEAATKSKVAPRERSFAPDRKGELSAGALASKDKKRSVAASRDGSNTR